MSDPPVELWLIPRKPPATPEWLAILLECYPAPCEQDCFHSSCGMIRDLQERLAA